MIRLLPLLAVLAGMSSALAQGPPGPPPITAPTNGVSISAAYLIDGSSQLALAGNGGRRGCIIRNDDEHNMTVTPAGGSPTTLAPDAKFRCAGSTVEIDIAGTAGDVYTVWNW